MGEGRSVAQGDGFHVKEADVHLCLDVYPLPDLEQTEQCERASPPESSATFPAALLRHPLRSSRRWNPLRSVEEKLPSAFLLVNWALTFGFFMDCHSKLLLSTESKLLAEVT